MSVGLLTAILQESLQGSSIVKAFGMERHELARFNRENREIMRYSLRASRVKAIMPSATEIVASLGIAGVFWYGGNAVMDGSSTQGQFVAFLTAIYLAYDPFKRLTRTLPEIYQGIAGGDRIFEVLDASLDIADAPDAASVAPFADRIAFRNVGFGYLKEPVLTGIDLEIRRGEMVALVGPSGAGKTTLSALVPRFYDVSSGAITLDGIDIRKVTLESLRNQIGIVTQHTFLFNDTVRNNISYGDPSKGMEEIIAAAKAANAHDFIMELPLGYDTVIGELGLRLSGGQRQRIAIARAVLKNAPVLILDEATSSLDSESERLVQEALDNLMENRTSLVIAHRLSTIHNATRIVVVARGAIVEEGTHQALLSRGKEYAHLYTSRPWKGVKRTGNERGTRVRSLSTERRVRVRPLQYASARRIDPWPVVMALGVLLVAASLPGPEGALHGLSFRAHGGLRRLPADLDPCRLRGRSALRCPLAAAATGGMASTQAVGVNDDPHRPADRTGTVAGRRCCDLLAIGPSMARVAKPTTAPTRDHHPAGNRDLAEFHTLGPPPRNSHGGA